MTKCDIYRRLILHVFLEDQFDIFINGRLMWCHTSSDDKNNECLLLYYIYHRKNKNRKILFEAIFYFVDIPRRSKPVNPKCQCIKY